MAVSLSHLGVVMGAAAVPGGTEAEVMAQGDLPGNGAVILRPCRYVSA